TGKPIVSPQNALVCTATSRFLKITFSVTGETSPLHSNWRQGFLSANALIASRIKAGTITPMAPKPDTTEDKLAMLLSTDWLSPYWSVIGIDAEDRVCFRRGCRDIVKGLIGAAENYYLISFADERISATRDAVNALVATCKLSGRAAATLHAICIPRVGRHEEQTAAWMLTTITLDELTQDIQLAPAVRELLLRSRKFYAFDSEALAESCKTSRTEWDLYVQQLTPELPYSLSDFVCVGLVPELQMDFILGQLDPEQ